MDVQITNSVGCDTSTGSPYKQIKQPLVKDGYNLIKDEMSRVVRKPTFWICENKDADQIRGNREADQRLCFRYTDSTSPSTSYIQNFKLLAIFCGCTAWV